MVNAYTPTNLQAALDALSSERLIPYAGGTDLMVKERHEAPFLFLNRIEELRRLTEDDEHLRIGAALTYRELLAHPLTPLLLKEAVSSIAAPAIRNTGTLGGNVANASPKGDGALVCFVSDSLVRLVGAGGAERVLPIAEFYQGRGRTVRRPDELLVEILMPKRWLAGFRYCKVGARKALAISRVSFAGLCAVEGGVVAHLAMAFGAVEDVVVRRPELDRLLIGRTLDEARALKEEVLAAWDEALVPLKGRVPAEYRKRVCLNLARDFLEGSLV
jgi:CO/xanthine dehydrogenase FAD-binding subunit